MKNLAMRFGAVLACGFLIACGGDSDYEPAVPEDLIGLPPPPVPEELFGLWSDAPQEEAIQASAEGQDALAVLHEGFGTGDGRLRIVLTIAEDVPDLGGRVIVAQYFGELVLEGDAISARLNYFALEEPPFGGLEPQPGVVLLSGVAVDAETLSFVLETESGQGADEFGTQEFFLSKSGVASPETENPFLKFAGMFEADSITAGFLGSTYEFQITFPSDTGEGFGTIAGDCNAAITLQALGDEVPSEYTRVRLEGCTDGEPFAGPTDLYGYSIVIAPFDPARPFISISLGGDEEILSLVGVRPDI